MKGHRFGFWHSQPEVIRCRHCGCRRENSTKLCGSAYRLAKGVLSFAGLKLKKVTAE